MKINKVKKLTSCKHLNLFSIQYKDRLNKRKEWIFASRSKMQNPLKQNKLDAVVIVPFHTKSKKLVMIKELRLTLSAYQYGFPAGLIDKGESIKQAGKRELFEDTGLRVTKVLKTSPAIFSSSGLTDESISMLFVKCKGKITNHFNEASEDIKPIMISQKKALKLIKDKKRKFDVKSWIVLNTFANHKVF